MSGRLWRWNWYGPRTVAAAALLWLARAAFVFFAMLACNVLVYPAKGQERRERELNRVYAERRAKLAAQLDAPVILWGLTGREENSQAYVFAQEENFYYLTGHNEEGAGLILLPAMQGGQTSAISPA